MTALILVSLVSILFVVISEYVIGRLGQYVSPHVLYHMARLHSNLCGIILFWPHWTTHWSIHIYVELK